MASIPPRTSYTMSPHLRTPDDNKSRALVAITTKDSSPAAAAFPTGRSPLGSLGTNSNTMGFGMRQRRQPQAFEANPFFNGGETIKGPPRKSLTMSMGGPGVGGAVAPKADVMKNGLVGPLVDKRSVQQDWILVFGFNNKDQRDEVVRKYKTLGNVVDVKMASGSKNWVALCYDSKLAVEAVVCERDFQMTDGSFCGVRRLPNSQEFFLEQQRLYSSVVSQNGGEDNLFFSDKTTAKVAEIEEVDILMVAKTEKGPARGKSCCESLMGWIYGW